MLSTVIETFYTLIHLFSQKTFWEKWSRLFPRSLRTHELHVAAADAMNICPKALSYQELTENYCLSPKIQGEKLHKEAEILDCGPRAGVEADLSEFYPCRTLTEVPRHTGRRGGHPLAPFCLCIRKQVTSGSPCLAGPASLQRSSQQPSWSHWSLRRCGTGQHLTTLGVRVLPHHLLHSLLLWVFIAEWNSTTEEALRSKSRTG